MNDLEKSIMQFISVSYPDELNGICLQNLKVIEREFTGAGVIVSFEQASQVSSNNNYHLTGPLILAPELELGAETVLGFQDGKVDFLDILVRGNGNIQVITDFQLVDEDVNYINDTDA